MSSTLLNRSEVQRMRRRDVIIDILKELVQTGITKINFRDLVIDYIASGEFRYGNNVIISKLFVGDICSETDMEDYAKYYTLKNLMEIYEKRDDLESVQRIKERLCHLRFDGEVGAPIAGEFERVLTQEGLVFFRIRRSDMETSEYFLELPRYENIPPIFQGISRLKPIAQVKENVRERNLKRKETLERKRQRMTTLEHNGVFMSSMAIQWNDLTPERQQMLLNKIRGKPASSVRKMIARRRKNNKNLEASLMQYAYNTGVTVDTVGVSV